MPGSTIGKDRVERADVDVTLALQLSTEDLEGLRSHLERTNNGDGRRSRYRRGGSSLPQAGQVVTSRV
jgi:hypothetical protein